MTDPPHFARARISGDDGAGRTGIAGIGLTMIVHMYYKSAKQASARIRLAQMAPHLERLGLESRLGPYPRDAEARARVEREVRVGDVILIHRRFPSVRDGPWWRRLGVPVVFDFDDAIMWRRRIRFGSHFSFKRWTGFRRALQTYTGAVAGNDFLAKLWRTRGKPALVSPSPVPVDVPLASARPAHSLPRIGWLGIAHNQKYLKQIGGALQRLARERDFVLTVISSTEFELERCRVENVPWTLEGQEQATAQLDVGLMPMPMDSIWSKGKCAYKVFQYMAAEVPSVASDVGMNREVIEHGSNGLLARSEDDWVRCLKRLLDEGELRAALGKRGRELVRERYSYEALAPPLASFLRWMAAGYAQAGPQTPLDARGPEGVG